MNVSTVLPVAYFNPGGEDIPAFAVVEVMNDADVAANGVHSIKVRKSTGTGIYGIDLGKGSSSSGDGRYGQFGIPLLRPMWVKFNGSVAPTGTTVGPVSGQWYMDETGSGYQYLGVFNADAGLVLVIEKPGGQGGAQRVRFSVTAIDCDAHTGTGIVENIMCSGSDLAVGDTVSLYDPLAFFTGNPDLVIGKMGFATKMIGTDPYGGTCVYEVDATEDLGTNCA